MSFKSEASKVKANIAAGNYKEKTDVFAGFFDELTYGLKKQDEAKRQEDLEKKRETRANDREILRQQKEQDKLEQSQNRLANLYFTTTGQDSTAQNKAKVLSVIKDGGITNIANLNTLMSKTSQYVEGTAPSMEVAPGEVPFDMLSPTDANTQTDEILKQEKSSGTIEFGPQTEAYDTSKVTESNWVGVLNSLELAGKTKAVEEVKKVVEGNAWNQKINGVSKTDMAGKGVPFWEDFLRTVDETTSPDDYKFIKDGLEAATVREADPKFWEKPDTLVTYDADTLNAFLQSGNYPETSKAYKAINSFYTIKLALEGKAEIASLAGAGTQKLQQFLVAAGGRLSTDDVNTVNDMIEISKEFEKNGQSSATSKQIAQKAFIEQFNVNSMSPADRTKNMINFENAWTRATDLTKSDPEFWQKPDVLAKMETVDLKTMLDAGLLGGQDTEAYKTVLSTYQTKAGLETGDLEQLTSMSSDQIAKWFVANSDFFSQPGNENKLTRFELIKSIALEKENASVTPKTLTAKQRALESYIEQNDLQNKDATEVQALMGQFEVNWENITKQPPEWYTPEKLLQLNTNDLKVIIDTGILDTKPDILGLVTTMYETRSRISPQDIDTKQEALREYLALPENKNKTGLEKIKIITDFETTWKDDTAKTEDFKPVKLFLDGDSVTATSQVAYDAAIADGFKPLELGEVSQLMKDFNIDRETAQKINSGILQTGSDGFGRTVLIDKATGTVTQLKGQTDDTDTVNNSLTPAQVEERALAESEAIEALKKAGFAGQIDNLDDIAAAFGPESWLAKSVNTITGVFKATGMKNSAEAVSTLNALGKVTKFNIISGFNGLRDSVSLKAEVETLIPKSGKFFTSELDALRNFKDIKAVLDQAIIGQRNIASEGTGISTTAESNANVALKSLEPLSGLYGDVIAAMEGGQKSNAEPIDSSIFVTSKKPNRKQIRFLKDNPETKDQFDAKFGAGSSSSILGDN
jgi:hypothetical protein